MLILPDYLPQKEKVYVYTLMGKVTNSLYAVYKEKPKFINASLYIIETELK